jgi:hypothetical protein
MRFTLFSAIVIGGLACGAPTRTTFGIQASTYTTEPYVYGPTVSYVDAYPGWLWVDGQYRWVGGRQIWRDGYWVEDRPTYVYRPGYYHPRTRVWVSARWQPRHRGDRVYYKRIRHGDRVIYREPPYRRRY